MDLINETTNLTGLSNEPTETTVPQVTIKKKGRAPLISTIQAELLQQGRTVMDSWEKDEKVIIPYANIASGRADLDLLEQLLYGTKKVQVKRSPNSGLLIALNEKIDKHIRYPKLRMELQVGKLLVKDHFPSLGLEHKNKSFRIPPKSGARIIALTTLIATINKYEWTDMFCTAQFWQEMLDEYISLTTETTGGAQEESSFTADKGIVIERIRKVLRSIATILTGQYPDTYESVLRSWGFLREKN